MTVSESPRAEPSSSAGPTSAGAGPVPNAFIVGAPKSGTSALARYLSGHAEIFVAGKELSYFGSDLDFRTKKGVPWHITWDQYAAWFAGHDAERYRVDRSVFYLYSQRAAQEIHQHDPESRIIVMLRNPVDQMHSEHGEMLYQGEEDIADFTEALAAEGERRQGRRIPPGCQRAFGLFYRDLARYADQVERYLTVFGPDQVHVVVYDDLAADPATSYRRVLEFLGVDASHRPEFAVVNASKRVRSRALLRMLRTTSPAIRRLGRIVVPGQQGRARVRRSLHKLNTAERGRAPLSPALRRQLQAEFEPEVRRLEGMLGIDLASWRSTAVSG